LDRGLRAFGYRALAFSGACGLIAGRAAGLGGWLIRWFTGGRGRGDVQPPLAWGGRLG
jgi:hypothetical protein